MQNYPENAPSFQKKVWITTAIVSFTVVVLLLIKNTFAVFLLMLAGTLIALFFRGISSFIARKTKWNENLCVAISILGTLIIFAALFWLIGFKVQTQISELVETLPKTVENARQRLSETSIGKKIIDKMSSKSAIQNAQVFAGKFFKTTFGIIGDLYVVFFIGIFFTISPQTYRDGLVVLLPQNGKKKASDVLDALGKQLQKWLKGKIISMVVVAILTAIGLAIIGLPLWLILAILAGLISFIPNFGPLISFIPAGLIALQQGPNTAILVAGLYMAVQLIESNVITPLVQQKLLSMPPALIIIAQVIMGTLTGGWGLILATPLTVVIIVLVQKLYLEKKTD